MSNMGDYIKQKREEKKITIKYICNKTAIREQYVNMLEAGEFDSLPSYVHAHGFLEQYCKVVGLDFPNEVKPLFDQECKKATFGKTPEEIAMEQAAVEEAGKRPPYGIFAAVFAVIFLALVGLFIYNSVYKRYAGTPAVSTIPPAATPIEPPVSTPAATPEPAAGVVLPDNGSRAAATDNYTDNGTRTPVTATPPAASVVTPPAPVVTPATTSAPQQPAADNATVRRRAVLTFTDNCWVNFISDNGDKGDFIAEPGQEKVVYFSNYFSIDIGNASAISVNYRDRAFSGLGSYRQPVKGVYFVVDDNGTMTMQRTPPAAVR